MISVSATEFNTNTVAQIADLHDTSTLIHDALNDFAKRVNLGWQIEKFTRGEDTDVVKIGFRHKHSPTDMQNKSGKNFIKYGGHLAFSIQANGKVSVVSAYGYLEDGVLKSHVRLLECVHPDHINYSYVSRKVEEFLSACHPWETC